MTFTLCNYLCKIEVQVDPFEILLVIRLPDFWKVKLEVYK